MDCSKFYTCSLQTNGLFLQTRHKCPDPFFYDTKTESCRPRTEVTCEMVSITELLNLFENFKRDRKIQCQQNYTDDESIHRCMNETMPKTDVETATPVLTTDMLISTTHINVSTERILQSTTTEMNIGEAAKSTGSIIFHETTESINDDDDDEQIGLLDASTPLRNRHKTSTETTSTYKAEDETTINSTENTEQTTLKPNIFVSDSTISIESTNSVVTESTIITEDSTTIESTLNDEPILGSQHTEYKTEDHTASNDSVTELTTKGINSSDIFEISPSNAFETTESTAILIDQTTPRNESSTQTDGLSSKTTWTIEQSSTILPTTIEFLQIQTSSPEISTSQKIPSTTQSENGDVRTEPSTISEITQSTTNSPSTEEITEKTIDFGTNTPKDSRTFDISTQDILSMTNFDSQSTEATTAYSLNIDPISTSTTFSSGTKLSDDASEYPVNSKWNETKTTVAGTSNETTTIYPTENATTIEPTTVEQSYFSESTSSILNSSTEFTSSTTEVASSTPELISSTTDVVSTTDESPLSSVSLPFSEISSTFVPDSPTTVTASDPLNVDNILISSTTAKILPISSNDTAENKTAVNFESTIAQDDAINSTTIAINTFDSSSFPTEKTVTNVDTTTSDSYILSSSSTTQGVFISLNNTSEHDTESSTAKIDDISTVTQETEISTVPETTAGIQHEPEPTRITINSTVTSSEGEENETSTTESSTTFSSIYDSTDHQTSNGIFEKNTETSSPETTTENQGTSSIYPEIIFTKNGNLESDSLVSDSSKNPSITFDPTTEKSTSISLEINASDSMVFSSKQFESSTIPTSNFEITTQSNPRMLSTSTEFNPISQREINALPNQRTASNNGRPWSDSVVSKPVNGAVSEENLISSTSKPPILNKTTAFEQEINNSTISTAEVSTNSIEHFSSTTLGSGSIFESQNTTSELIESSTVSKFLTIESIQETTYDGIYETTPNSNLLNASSISVYGEAVSSNLPHQTDLVVDSLLESSTKNTYVTTSTEYTFDDGTSKSSTSAESTVINHTTDEMKSSSVEMSTATVPFTSNERESTIFKIETNSVGVTQSSTSWYDQTSETTKQINQNASNSESMESISSIVTDAIATDIDSSTANSSENLNSVTSTDFHSSISGEIIGNTQTELIEKTTQPTTLVSPYLTITPSSSPSQNDAVQNSTVNVPDIIKSTAFDNETSTFTDITQSTESSTDEETITKHSESTLSLIGTTPTSTENTTNQSKPGEESSTAVWEFLTSTFWPSSAKYENTVELIDTTTEFNAMSMNNNETPNTTDISINTTTITTALGNDTQANAILPHSIHNRLFDLDVENISGKPEINLNIKGPMQFNVNFTGGDSSCC